MATKKKPLLTAEQVTENLQRLFPGQTIRCTEVVGGHFYIETNIMKVAVVGKLVLEKPSIRRWADYIIWCNETGGIYSKVRTKLGTCIPFVYRKGRDARKQDDQCAAIILMACGLKAEPKAVKSPVDVLREISGKMAVDLYNVFSGVTVTRTDLFYGKDGLYQDSLFCKVTTATGSYQFSLTGLGNDKSRSARDRQDEQIKGIFFEMLGVPTTIWQKEETQIAA